MAVAIHVVPNIFNTVHAWIRYNVYSSIDRCDIVLGLSPETYTDEPKHIGHS